MLIFANPLGAPGFGPGALLVHPEPDLHTAFRELRRVGRVRRTAATGGQPEFHCYRLAQDVPEGQTEFDLLDPFPTPLRTTATQPRGQFRVDVRPLD